MAAYAGIRRANTAARDDDDRRSARATKPLQRPGAEEDVPPRRRKRAPEWDDDEDDLRGRRRTRHRDDDLEEQERELRRRRAAGGKNNRDGRKRKPRWVWAAVGVVGLLAATAAGFLVMNRGSRAGGGAGGPDHGLVAEAREPLKGTDDSTFLAEPMPAGEPSAWKVRTTAVPAATGLAPAFPLANRGSHVVVFAGPESPAAAVLYAQPNSTRVDWERHDLRKPARAPYVSFTVPWSVPPAGFVPAALSPSGECLALASPANWRTMGYVRADDGRVIALEPAGDTRQPVAWLGFAAEDRLLTLRGGDLTCHDLSTRERVFAVPVAHCGGATLTWDRKWVAVPTVAGSEWFSIADGSRAGRLPVPEGFREPSRNYFDNPRLAVTRDGKRVAGVAFNKRGDLLVAVWDLATGNPVESLVLPWKRTKAYFMPPLSWCGDRRLLFGTGEVVDLDLRTWLCKYEWHGDRYCRGRRPDDRCWFAADMHAARDRLNARYRNAFPGPDSRGFGPGHDILAACTVPSPLGTGHVDQALAGGSVWHPGVAVRVEVDESCPEEYRPGFLDAVSTLLTANCYRVDPAANVRIKLVPRVTGGKQTKEALDFGAIDQPKPEQVPDFVGNCSWEVTNRDGQRIFAVAKEDAITEPGTNPQGKDVVWKKLIARQSEVLLPRWYLRDRAGKRLHLGTPLVAVGADGFGEQYLLPTRDDKVEDPFRLDDDPEFME